MLLDNANGFFNEFFIKRCYGDLAWGDIELVAEHPVVAFEQVDEFLYAQLQKLEIERFGQIVVGSEFEPFEAVFLSGFGGQQYDQDSC